MILFIILSLPPYPDSNLSFQPSWDEATALVLVAQLVVERINNRSDVLGG